MLEDEARLSNRRSILTPWQRPVEQEERPSSSCWTSSMLNTCDGRQLECAEELPNNSDQGKKQCS